MSEKQEHLQYGAVVQFRCTPELEDMIKGDMANDGSLSLSQIARLRLEICYGLTGGPDVAHIAERPTTDPGRLIETQNVPQAAPPKGAETPIRERGAGGEKAVTTLEIVAHLARQVLAAQTMRILELREDRLWPLVDSGGRQEITERLSTEGLPLDDGIAGTAMARNQVWFGPVQDSYRGTLEERFKSVGCAPIIITQDGTSVGPVYGLLFLGYKNDMVPTSVGRINLVAFATALARIWGLDG